MKIHFFKFFYYIASLLYFAMPTSLAMQAPINLEQFKTQLNTASSTVQCDTLRLSLPFSLLIDNSFLYEYLKRRVVLATKPFEIEEIADSYLIIMLSRSYKKLILQDLRSKLITWINWSTTQWDQGNITDAALQRILNKLSPSPTYPYRPGLIDDILRERRQNYSTIKSLAHTPATFLKKMLNPKIVTTCAVFSMLILGSLAALKIKHINELEEISRTIHTFLPHARGDVRKLRTVLQQLDLEISSARKKSLFNPF